MHVPYIYIDEKESHRHQNWNTTVAYAGVLSGTIYALRDLGFIKFHLKSHDYMKMG